MKRKEIKTVDELKVTMKTFTKKFYGWAQLIEGLCIDTVVYHQAKKLIPPGAKTRTKLAYYIAAGAVSTAILWAVNKSDEEAVSAMGEFIDAICAKLEPGVVAEEVAEDAD